MRSPWTTGIVQSTRSLLTWLWGRKGPFPPCSSPPLVATILSAPTQDEIVIEGDT